MTGTNSDNYAVSRGFTRHVIVTGEGAEYAALIKPDADLDDAFPAYDTDNQEWLVISGWLCDIVEADAEPPAPRLTGQDAIDAARDHAYDLRKHGEG